MANIFSVYKNGIGFEYFCFQGRLIQIEYRIKNKTMYLIEYRLLKEDKNFFIEINETINEETKPPPVIVKAGDTIDEAKEYMITHHLLKQPERQIKFYENFKSPCSGKLEINTQELERALRNSLVKTIKARRLPWRGSLFQQDLRNWKKSRKS